MKIKHDSREISYRSPFGAVPVGTEIFVAIDISPGMTEMNDQEDDSPANVQEARPPALSEPRVRLMVWEGETLSPRYYDMQAEAGSSGETDTLRYTAVFKAPGEGVLLWYAFEIKDGDEGAFYYGNNRQALGGAGEVYAASPGCYQITVYKPAAVPEWYKNGIVYQIFPDRFCRDDDWRERTEAANEAVNSRRPDIRRTIVDDWYMPAYYGRDENGDVTEWPFYGGSFKGIESRLDYIRSLGVTCIYLNPVFEAVSNHRYDTSDYMHVDPVLGTDEDFRSLCAAARERGIRVMLDGVFSHTGIDSVYFENNKDWYKWDESEPTGYKSWWGVKDLPEVDEENESYREFITGSEGVVAHWLRMGASAWRLDVADELPDSFIEDVRRRVKAEDPGNVLIGEVWEDASNKISYDEPRRYLLGDELDGTMNYPQRDILLDYINYTIGSREAGERLESLRENYPEENFYGALNLIGSHDRVRILTLMAEEEDHDAAVSKVKLISALSYALPGVPCVYYGDEAGLTGRADPENRNCYPWGNENKDLLYHYRMMGLIYDQHPALAGGDFEMLSAGPYAEEGWDNDDVFAFVRRGRDRAGTDETILVLASRSYGDSYVDLSPYKELNGAYALELLDSKEMELDEDGSLGTVRMDRLSVKIISIRGEAPVKEKIERSAGVIAHISSIPGGQLGAPARAFVDFIASAGFRVWQVLPLNPAGKGGSPYSSYAAFAGETGFINASELPSEEGYEDFIRDNSYWLNDYIAYTLIKESQGGKPWTEWPAGLRDGSSVDILMSLTADQEARADELCKEQYYFCRQWDDLKSYANSKGVMILGDLPMFMSEDSVDVWANKDIFLMDEDGRLRVHAGVPPDAFTGEGQDWGNPLYDWEELAKTGYDWYMKRLRQCAERYDILRIDHFRGLSEYYAIPEGGTAFDGAWQHGPGVGFIAETRKMLEREGLSLRFLAEDLGYLDAGSMDLLKLSGMPGMDVWQFSADEMMEMSNDQPRKAGHRAFYTGTHDNDTLLGFLSEKRGPGDNNIVSAEIEALDVIRKIYGSPAVLAMLQLQDVFMLGSEARMNIPGIAEGNWTWHVPGSSIQSSLPNAGKKAAWLRKLAVETGRI